jgi:hypothetical protein
MAKADSKNTTNTPDPVMQLATRLNDLHDAVGVVPPGDDNDEPQLNEWIHSVETLISYAVAESPEGVIVQLALALDSIHGVSIERGEEAFRAEKLRLGRLVRSAMRVVYASVGPEMSTATRRLASIYDTSDTEADFAGPKIWAHQVKDWAEEARREDTAAA